MGSISIPRQGESNAKVPYNTIEYHFGGASRRFLTTSLPLGRNFFFILFHELAKRPSGGMHEAARHRETTHPCRCRESEWGLEFGDGR
jgi:hypothetical protein